MAITIDLSSLGDGTYSIEDDGTLGNGTSVVRDPFNNIVTTFAHPADTLTILSRAGQSININFTDSLTPADFIVGSLTTPSQNPDVINVGEIVTSGTVTLAANFNVNEFGSDASQDIVAGELFIDAGTRVGGGNAIETQVSVLEAESVTGGIRLSNINDLTIGGAGGTAQLGGLRAGTSGEIVLTNQGSITLADDDGFESVRSAGNLTLAAIGALADISSIVDQDALLVVGNIQLSAGRDVLFGTGGINFDNDVRAGGSVNVAAGRDFHIDGFSDMASDDQGLGSNGGIIIGVGRDILIEDNTGFDASVGVSGSGSFGQVLLTTGAGGTFSLAAGSSTALFASHGGVIVNADRILIESDSGINVLGSGAVELNGRSVAKPIFLGSAADGAIAVELSDGELDRVLSPIVRLGNPITGDIALTGQINSGGTDVLSLETAGRVIDATGAEQPDITETALAIRTGLGIGVGDDLDIVVATLAFRNTGGKSTSPTTAP
jgi:hypothetical protein